MSDLKMEFNWGDPSVDQFDWTFQPMPMAFEEKEEEGELVVDLRRSSFILTQAREHSLALSQNLLKAVDPGWQKKEAKVGPGDTCRLTPQAYRFKDIYEGKKKQQLRKCLEVERKQREFHSRPMPNFRQFHERQAAQTAVHRFTLPVTPNVLKNSAPAELRRRQRLEEKLKLELDVHTSTRPSLKPLNSQSRAEPRIQIQPFNLSAEKRVQKRRLFNAQTTQLQEARRQQQEEQRLRAEREDYQKHRQMTTFRARPNPFSASPR